MSPVSTTALAVRGAVLATDLCLPDGPGPHPAVLVRTPYDRRAHHAELRSWARHGFAAVAQDVRGRHGSTGEWHPYRHEAQDGAATLRWLRGRPWSDGRVVACGASYAAHCALAPALGPRGAHGPRTAHGPGAAGPAPAGAAGPARGPDAVIAAVPALGPAETAREPCGAERLHARAGWWAAHGDRPDSDPGALDRILAADPHALEHLPVADLPGRLGLALPSWPLLWAAGRTGGEEYADAAVPLLAVGGTHDPFAAETVELWRRWGTRTGAPARLLLGPWGHALTAQPGPDAGGGHRIGLGRAYAEFARAALAGAPGARPDGPALRGGAFALGGTPGHWLDARHWDPAPTEVPLLGGPLRMRVLRGERFTADPADPVRSDRLAVPASGTADRCLAVSAPLDAPLHLAGPVAARLHGTADTPAADWIVRLVALGPDGRAAHLATGVARTTAPPGTGRDVTVRLGPVARRLPAGVRLRVEIAGHHFPAHARNPHTGEDPVHAKVLHPSRRTVLPARGSLNLPVLDPGTAARTTARPAQEASR
ncbi:CocE/NonD family hydrolase [Streptomyces sp. HB2AG]|uniref:CocE/NonD family hydrolase n=1 Tax=Streptomyces sp. HB2AG TaxID=2983400 RepID=UPI0022AB065E|nr:CocE/NonD family hydrolase [Streptomyces sp. HB2AG]MCZ2527539.1 CocE/NonD family hydrolase [Streptomyces sp. HB2AG]